MDYVALATRVKSIIQNYGREVTFQKLSSVPSDPLMPWRGQVTPQVVASVTTTCLFVPATGSDLGLGWVADNLLTRANQVGLLAATPEDLDDFQVIVDGSEKFGIEWIQLLKPADTKLLYAIGVMR